MPSLFLVRYPERPVIVPRTDRVSIGRAENNTIVLTEGRVSRMHAIVEWREQQGRFVIMDLGSANGTMLNNERLQQSKEYLLKDWDKVRIASAVFTIRFVDNPDVILQEFAALTQRIHSEATQVVPRSMLHGAKPAASPALSGTLEHLCPIDLFQMLETGRKTGRLSLKTPDAEGTFSFLRGAVVSAHFGGLGGEDAVYGTLTCSHGSFAFLPQAETEVDVSGRLKQSTTALLMEGCRLLDERNATGSCRG